MDGGTSTEFDKTGRIKRSAKRPVSIAISTCLIVQQLTKSSAVFTFSTSVIDFSMSRNSTTVSMHLSS